MVDQLSGYTGTCQFVPFIAQVSHIFVIEPLTVGTIEIIGIIVLRQTHNRGFQTFSSTRVDRHTFSFLERQIDRIGDSGPVGRSGTGRVITCEVDMFGLGVIRGEPERTVTGLVTTSRSIELTYFPQRRLTAEIGFGHV